MIIPYKSRYWLNPKIDNIEEYEQQVKELCDIYLNAEKLHSEGLHIISTDEKTGILKNIKSRQKFLKDKKHRIYFVYTPKHCSWLNQVEIWFSILARKVLKRGNFISTEDLREKLENFISYFNRTMGKPFKWTYKGKPLTI